MLLIPTFEEEADRRAYRLGVSQVLTKNLVMNFEFEGATDEGFLRNPYRFVRYLIIPGDPSGGDAFQDELYPETRDSNAFSINGRYFLESQASALYGGARIFNDSWGIERVRYKSWLHTGNI